MPALGSSEFRVEESTSGLSAGSSAPAGFVSPPAPSGPVVVKGYRGTFVLAILGLITLGASVALPWATGSFSGGSAAAYVYGTTCGTYSGITTCISGYSTNSGIQAAEYLVFAALAFAVFAVVFAVLGVRGKVLGGTQARLTSLFVILSFVTAFLSGGAWYGSFNWGPGTSPGVGLALVFAAALVFLVGMFFARRERKNQRATLEAAAMTSTLSAPATIPPPPS